MMDLSILACIGHIDRKFVVDMDYNFTRNLKIGWNSFIKKKLLLQGYQIHFGKICTDLDGKLESQLMAIRFMKSLACLWRRFH